MKTHLHCLCWNEIRLLPVFFHRYDSFVELYHIWDKGSTDGSLNLLQNHPKVRLHRCSIEGDSSIEWERQHFNKIWKESRQTADWVILVNIDEHIYHPDLPGYLKECADRGVTAIRGIGYEMIGDDFPKVDQPDWLLQNITLGCRSAGLDRLCIFSPNALTNTNFAAGRHQAWPEGHVVWPESPQILLLRYALLGVDYFIERIKAEAATLRPGDIAKGWAAHLLWTEPQIREHASNLSSLQQQVPGLGKLAHVSPKHYRGDEGTVESSGLLDPVWYWDQYPDVKKLSFDPLVHFCNHGWKEGRRPNPYFDTLWYQEKYLSDVSSDINPLVDYIQRGELANANPSVYFDTGWYRKRHQLPVEESPLRHYLLRRLSGSVSPNSKFKLERYLDAHPQLRESGQDVYLHSLAIAHPAEQVPNSALLTIQTVLQMVGVDSAIDAVPATIAWESFKEVLRKFLPLLPFDEVWYRETYPDVGTAVQMGHFSSAHEHYIIHGFFEGRSGTPPKTAPDPV